MKRQLILHCAVLGICTLVTSAAVAQTTATRGTPTISGFAPNAVSGFTARPVTGFAPEAIRGLAPLPEFPRTTNFTTGPISPLSTTIGGVEVNSATPLPVVPPAPVVPVPSNVPNEVGTPLF